MARRLIPATMASQHPDHARVPFFQKRAFISTRAESKECFLTFSKLGVSEYKWDWEGKLVDESVIERLLASYFQYFKKNPLGEKKFLTFRLPNPQVETEFRLGRAFTSMLTAAGLTKELGFRTAPLFEAILPMTESAKEMIEVQEAFAEMTNLKHRLYGFANGRLRHLEIIPLFEQVEVMMDSDTILRTYLTLHQKKFGFTPTYLRPYVARSDPALNSGLVPTVLAIKVALAHYRVFEERYGVELFPIIGSASLPFRGGLTPETVKQFMAEYPGVRTALLQSAFRYDFDRRAVVKAVRVLERNLAKQKAVRVSSKEEQELRAVMGVFERPYRRTVEGLAPLINRVARELPKRRERVQHIGLFGYSRGVGRVKLPRAIGFTGAMYSLGIPPELVGTGKGLIAAAKMGKMGVVEKYYVNLTADLRRAGRFLNKPLVERLAKKSEVWRQISRDIEVVEQFLGEELGPQTTEELEHRKLTDVIYDKVKQRSKSFGELGEAAILRKSLG